MDLTDEEVISLFDDYGFEFGKTYKVSYDDSREITMENGQRFFKDTFHLYFAKGYSELFAKVKNIVDSKHEENHKLCIDNMKLEAKIDENKNKYVENNKLINRLVKLL
jgi:hypothetical protein